MILNLCSFTNSGATIGTVRINLEFANRTWTVPDDPFHVWARIAHSNHGDLEVKGNDLVAILEHEPGKISAGPLVTLSYVPPFDSAIATSGSGKVVGDALDPALRGGGIFWSFESPTFSPLRSAVLELLTKTVPPGGLTSDMAAFRSLTGYDTKRIKADFWENPVKPSPTWTCCNLFVGSMAIRIGSLVGKTPGRWLTAGVLELSRADKDVPGSWVTPDGDRFPKPGDFISLSGYNQYHDFQQYKHVGIVGKVENGHWVTVDGGQGSRPHFDAIKWTDRGAISTTNLNGWVDIDRYFGR